MMIATTIMEKSTEYVAFFHLAIMGKMDGSELVNPCPNKWNTSGSMQLVNEWELLIRRE